MDRIKVMENKFERFFEQEDLKFTRHIPDENKDEYVNVFTRLNHCHDFEYNSVLKRDYNHVREKFDRRINRLLKKMEASKNVLLVYMENPNSTLGVATDEELSKSPEVLNSRYKTNISILYFKHNPNFEKNHSEICRVNNGLTKITLLNKDLATPVNTGNLPVIKTYLEGLKLKRPIGYKIIRRLEKIRERIKLNGKNLHIIL